MPHLSDDYIHRVGRTARAGAVGEALTFVSPEEEQDLRPIERAIGKRLPRKVVEDFDYGPAPSRRPHGRAPQHGRPQHPLHAPQRGRPHQHGRPSQQHGRAEQNGHGPAHAPSRGSGFAPPRRQKAGRRGRRMHGAR